MASCNRVRRGLRETVESRLDFPGAGFEPIPDFAGFLAHLPHETALEEEQDHADEEG
jgi:hypothetical protein